MRKLLVVTEQNTMVLALAAASAHPATHRVNTDWNGRKESIET